MVLVTPLLILTAHDDSRAGGGVAKGVGQGEGVQPRVVSPWLDDHQASLAHQVV